MRVEAPYLNPNDLGLPEYRISLTKRFRSLKLWFVLRLYGAEKLRAHIRKHVSLAHLFESLLLKDSRFELFNEVTLGLICFRIKGSNELNKELLELLYTSGKIHLIPSIVRGVFFLRIVVCSSYTEERDIRETWAEIQRQASNLPVPAIL